MNYENGKIYKLCNYENDDIYIGSTIQTLCKRFSKHKSNASRYPERNVYKGLAEVGWCNVDIILLEAFPCENKMQLEQRERHWIDLLQPKLNKIIPNRTPKEYYDEHRGEILKWNKDHRLENIDVYKHKDKLYYESNKRVCKQRMKKYFQENKDRIKLRSTAKHNCECGGKYTAGSRAIHFRTNKHQLHEKAQFIFQQIEEDIERSNKIDLASLSLDQLAKRFL